MANYRSWQADMQGFLRDLVLTHGDIVAFSLGSQPCVLVHGSVYVKELFHTHAQHLRKPRFLKDSNRGYWGDGLTTLEGACWQQRRHMLQEVFHSSRIHSTRGVMVDCTKEMLDSWEQDAVAKPDEGVARDLSMDLRILTARIAARVILDADIETLASGEGRSGLVPLREVFGEDFTSSSSYDPQAPVFLRRPRAPRQMSATLAIIEERLRSGEDRGDLLSGILSASKRHGTPLTRPDIIGEVIQLLYAGHITIPSALLNFWQDISVTFLQDLIIAEAGRLFDGAVPSLETVRSSICMTALRESLRLHPPAPILYREVGHPFTLADYCFPAGWAVWISPHLMHRDPRYFPEPEKFLPERFSSGSGSAMLSPAYMPFGTGPRTCIAHTMAVDQMALVALFALCRFRLLPSSHPSHFIIVSKDHPISDH